MDDWLELELDCCAAVVSCGPEAFGGVELAGGVVLLGGVLVLGDVLLLGGVLGEELLGLFTSGVVELLGGVLVLGDVLLLGGWVELLGLETSLCGMVPAALQSEEIIFTLLTLMVLELEDEGVVLLVDGLVLLGVAPDAELLPELLPVTWIIWPTWAERLEVSPCSE